MSRARRTSLAKLVYAAVLLGIGGGLGCWEQWSEEWFPQMKWQKAVQAYEETLHEGKPDPFMPPLGTVPVTDQYATLSVVDHQTADALVNPEPMTLASVNNGKQVYEEICATCHGLSGMGNGTVSMTGGVQSARGPQPGPIGGILPMTVTAARSDGHIFTTITNGIRRMPNYRRIPVDDRWDVVNYLRYMTKQKGIQ